MQNILIEEPLLQVKQLTFNRESKLNALNPETIGEVISAFENFSREGVKVVILTGAGEKSFVAGADISKMKEMNLQEIEEFAAQGQKMVRTFELFDGIVIAAVNGFALGGGCELMLGCDWAVGTQNALIGQPEVKIGVIPGFGGSQRLTRLVGRFHATKMIVDGKPIKADEALRIGLLTKVYPDKASMMADCLETAKTILANSFQAVAKSKQAIRRGADTDLANACLMERDVFCLCFGHPDQKEGMGAFLEKRAPNFKS